MSATQLSGANYIAVHDEEVSPALTEIAEFVAHISASWTKARLAVRADPKDAYAALVEAEVDYETYVEIRLIQCMNRIRSALDRLEAELPDGRAPFKGDRPAYFAKPARPD